MLVGRLEPGLLSPRHPYTLNWSPRLKGWLVLGWGQPSPEGMQTIHVLSGSRGLGRQFTMVMSYMAHHYPDLNRL